MPRIRQELMMSDTSGQVAVIGEKVPADSWYAPTDGSHTVEIRVASFHGRVGIQGTLVEEPEEADWFPINLDGTNAWLEFPLEGDEATGTTGTFAYVFEGKFVWLRAVMDRGNLPPGLVTQDNVLAYGSVIRILLAR